MSFGDTLRSNGVKVFKGHFNSNAWTVETVEKAAFLELAKMSGFAFHEDKQDIYYNTHNVRIDREIYITAYQGLIVKCVVEGE